MEDEDELHQQQQNEKTTEEQATNQVSSMNSQ